MSDNRYVFSILGDSISTYYGYNPDGFSVFYDVPCCQRNGLQTVNDTWWMQVINHYNGILGINNSYSGSRVSGKTFPSANQENRLLYLKSENETSPDYILIYLGFNDFGAGVHINPNRMSFHKTVDYFGKAYNVFLQRLKKLFPESVIICGTLMRTYIGSKSEWVFPDYHNGHTPFDRYNDVIADTCRRNAVCLADLSKLSIKYETQDGSHPTVTGHKEIAGAWILSLDELGVI